MPRKARKDIIGHQEDIERQEREEAYAELRRSLRSDWRSRDGQAVAGDEPEDACDEQE